VAALGVAVTALTFFSTCGGGLLALRVRDRLHLLLGFSAGAILGVVLFDILPDVVDRAGADHIAISNLMVATAAGFLAFFCLERITKLHSPREHEHHAGIPHGGELGILGAAGLSFHSYLDGLAITVGFRTGAAVGAVIAVAVLAHDFDDGLNTVTVVLAHGNPARRARQWLLVDATTPLLGALTGLVAPIPTSVLPYILATFAGSFLYIGASDLLPEAREHDSPLVLAAAVLGMAVLFGVARAAASA